MCLQRTGDGPDIIRAAPMPRDSSMRPERQRQHHSTRDRYERQTPTDVVIDLGSGRRSFVENQHASLRPWIRNAPSFKYGSGNGPITDHGERVSKIPPFRSVTRSHLYTGYRTARIPIMRDLFQDSLRAQAPAERQTKTPGLPPGGRLRFPAIRRCGEVRRSDRPTHPARRQGKRSAFAIP